MTEYKHVMKLSTDDSQFFEWLKTVIPECMDCKIEVINNEL